MVKKTKNKKVAIAVALVGIILIAAVFVFLKTKGAADDTNGELKIETGYCDLYYPARWKNNIEIQQEENTIRFQAEIKGYQKQPLFDVHFESDEGAFYGTVLVGEVEVPVSLTIYPIVQNEGWDQEQMDMLYGMQEDMNYLLEKLQVENSQPAVQRAEPQEVIDIEYEDIVIDTPYGQLKFPGMWEPYLQTYMIEDEICIVEFFANVKDYPEQHLFDVLIGTDVDGEFLLSSENGNEYFLNIEYVLSEVDDTWEAEDADILYGMMEGTNYLIEQLETAEEE